MLNIWFFWTNGNSKKERKSHENKDYITKVNKNYESQNKQRNGPSTRWSWTSKGFLNYSSDFLNAL